MQVETQMFLDLIEQAHKLVFFDLESMGHQGDYGSVICVSFKPYGLDPYTVSIKQVGNDQQVVRRAKEELEKYHCWCGYYSRGFDILMLNTRLLKWSMPPVAKRHHLDMYYSLKHNLLTSRRSQAHLLSWVRTPEQKMSVSASDWSELPFKLNEHLPTMIKRCESDVIGLEALYKQTRHVIGEIKL